MPYAQTVHMAARQTSSLIVACLLMSLSACSGRNGVTLGGGAPPAAVAPSITTQPADQTISAGQPASFTVAASGTAPISYQWQRGGASITGATDSTYTLSSAATSDTGAKFSVLVSNSAGSVTSSVATLTVTAPPNLIGSAGGKVSSDDQGLSVTVAPAALKGDTTFSFKTLTSLTNLPSGYVLVSGTAYEIDWTGAGFVGDAQVTLSFANPQSQAQAQASQGRKLQRRNHQARPRDSSSSTGAVVQCGDSTQVYDVTVDPNASSYSDATAILCGPSSSSGDNSDSQSQVGLVQPQSGQSLTITSPPTDETVAAGTSASFRVVAESSSTLSYQWRSNGNDIPGANSAAYSFTAQLTDSGNKYSVVVTDATGSLTSSDATLTVIAPQPPAAPQWGDVNSVSPTTGFSDNVGAPQVGNPFGSPTLLAWNNNGVLGSDNAAINSLALPMQGTPLVLSGPNLTIGYILFVDDDGTGNCPAGSGNRLSAIAEAFTFESGPLPPSDRYAIYGGSGSSVGCIQSFAAGIGIDYKNKISAAINFAVMGANSTGITIGSVGIYTTSSDSNGMVSNVWTETTPSSAPLATSADCSTPASLSSDLMRGVVQALSPPDPDLTTATHSATPLATLAYVSAASGSGVVCVAQFDGADWSMATSVIANANLETKPSVAIDANGDSLVLASVIDTTATTLSYAMTAAYRGGSDSAWQVQPLDSRDAAALPSAAFDYNGNAFAVWRPNSSSGKSVVYAARMSAGGSWDAPAAISAATTLETRYPRISVDARGNALALFEQSDTGTAPFTVVSTVWSEGLWSDIAVVQTDGNDGRFAEAPRNAEIGQGLYIAWRETDPTDSTGIRTRVVSCQMLSGPYHF